MRLPSPRLVTAAVVVVAAVGQIRVWSSGRGLWLDELSIAINLREFSWSELAGPLYYRQVAPVGWLAVEKAVRDWLGEHELLLRLPSLAAGLLVLVLSAVIARRAIGEWAAVAAAALVGLSPMLLYYSGELKQYATEAAVALVLLVMGDQLARRDRQPAGRPWRAVAAWAVVAVVALTLSYSGLVVLAGVATGLGARFLAGRRWRSLLALAAVAVPAAAVGGALAWHRRSQPMAPGIEAHFRTGLPAEGDGLGGLPEWLPQMWTGFVENPLSWRSGWWTLVLLIGGLVALVARQRLHWAAMFAGVFGVAVAAAAVRGLPLADRVALYLVAPAILLTVAALDGLIRGLRWLGQHAPDRPVPAVLAHAGAAVVAAAVVASSVMAAGPKVGTAVDEAVTPANPDRGREALADLGARIRPDDVVVSYWYSEQLVRWYGPDAGVEVSGEVRLYPAGDVQCRPGSVEALLAGASRVWYLQGERASTDPDDHLARVARELARHGEIVDSYRGDAGEVGTGPGWLLLDLGAGPDPAPPPVEPDPEFTCLGAHDWTVDGHPAASSGGAPSGAELH